MFMSFGSGTLASPAQSTYISVLGGFTAESAVYAPPVVDGSSNIYYPGYYLNTGSLYRGVFVKTDAAGTILLQRQLAHSTEDLFFNNSGLDGSGNIYLLGMQYVRASSGTTGKLVLAKYNSAGTFQWARILTWASGSFDPAKMNLAVSSAGDCYVCGSYQTGGNNTPFIAKYNTSGVIQWQYTISIPSNSNCFCYRLALDEANNRLYCGGVINPTNNGRYLIRLDTPSTTPTVNWGRRYDASGSVTSYVGLVLMSNGDVTGLGFVNGGGSQNFSTMERYTATGTVSWTNSITVATGTRWLLGEYLARDSADNLYMAGHYGDLSLAPSADVALSWKTDGSGNGQWLRSLTPPTTPGAHYGVSLVGASTLVYSAVANSGGVILKVPTDGTKTGTYSGYVYAAQGNITVNTPSVPSFGVSYFSISPTLTAGTVTDAAASLTDSASSLTRTLITIP